MRPTHEGWTVIILALGLGVVAMVSGNNLLVLVTCAAVTLLWLDLVWGQWNIRNLEVVRRLPRVLRAGTDAHGFLVVRNRRSHGTAVAIEVTDSHGASARVSAVGPGAEVVPPVRWRFSRRGRARLGSVRVRTAFPFGLFHHEHVTASAVELVIWPEGRSGMGSVRHGPLVGRREGLRAGGDGDFLGLRSWMAGDSLRRVHWRTSARTGELVVVQRARDAGTDVDVVLHDAWGAAWEDGISRAAVAVDQAIRQGRRVALWLPGDHADASVRQRVAGATGRRMVLDILACLPEREAR